jgi:hypothetical protein
VIQYPLRPLLLGLILLTAGCAPGPLVVSPPDLEVPAEFPQHSARQIIALMSAAPVQVTSFRSEARLATTSPGESQNATASIYDRNDSLLAIVRGPMGIEAGRWLVTRDSFYFHDRIQNRLYFGPVEAASAFIPGAVSFDEIVATFIGLVLPEPEIEWTVRADDRYYYLEDPDVSRTFVIDPAVWRAVRYEERQPGRSLARQLRLFSEFDTVDGLVLPRRVELQSPVEGTGAVIEHVRLSLNVDNPPIRFNPVGAERIRLG